MAPLEHLRPRAHALQHLLLDLAMRVAIGRQAQQRICESLRGEFAVQLWAAVLAQRIGEFEGVELDVGVAVRQAFDEGGYGLGGARG